MKKKSNILLALLVSTLGISGISNAKADIKSHEILTLSDFNKKVSSDTTVKRKEVTFINNKLKMAGILFSPANLDEGKKYPSVVVLHPGGGIKEQTASLYAYRLAQQGFVALAFDASHQGASEGEPRLLENPIERVEDVRSAVDYLTTIPYIDRERIGALGICAGGAYAIAATITEKRIKAVVSVSAVNIGDGFRKGWLANTPVSEQLATLKAIADKRTEVANGKDQTMVNYVPETVDKSTPHDLVEATAYYRTEARWKHANAPNTMLFTSIDKIFAFDAYEGIETLLTQPLLLIAGSKAESLWHSQRAYKLAKSSKELFLVKGGTHMSLYDKDVMKVIPKISQFFNKNLASK